MSNGNFPNGSLVMRVWRFDGAAELLAKFQYWSDAAMFASAKADKESQEQLKSFFYLAVCDYECKSQGFGVEIKPKSVEAAPSTPDGTAYAEGR